MWVVSGDISSSFLLLLILSPSPGYSTRCGETPFGEPSTQSYISHAEGVRYIHCCWDLQGRRTVPARGAQRGESSNTVRLHSWMYRSRMRARLSMVQSRGLRPLAPPWLSQSSRSTRSDSSSRLCNLPDRSVATATAGKLQRRSRREGGKGLLRKGQAGRRGATGYPRKGHPSASRTNASPPRGTWDEEPPA